MLQVVVEVYPYRHSRQHQRTYSPASSTLCAAHSPTPLQHLSLPTVYKLSSSHTVSLSVSRCICGFYHSSQSFVIWMYSSVIVCTIAKDSLRALCSSFVLGTKSAGTERVDRSWPVSSICAAAEFPWGSNVALCGGWCCVRTEDEEL